MTEKKFEDLSAWMDGESGTGMIGETCNDKELSSKWRNYHLIRDGLRKELPSQLNFDISESVARAIADEPAILAPKKGLRAPGALTNTCAPPKGLHRTAGSLGACS